MTGTATGTTPCAPQEYDQAVGVPDPFDQPSRDLAWLCHPALTGLPAQDRDALLAALMTLHDQQRETSLDQRRGHRPRLAAPETGRVPSSPWPTGSWPPSCTSASPCPRSPSQPCSASGPRRSTGATATSASSCTRPDTPSSPACARARTCARPGPASRPSPCRRRTAARAARTRRRPRAARGATRLRARRAARAGNRNAAWP
jgi:hypothetical protein